MRLKLATLSSSQLGRPPRLDKLRSTAAGMVTLWSSKSVLSTRITSLPQRLHVGFSSKVLILERKLIPFFEDKRLPMEQVNNISATGDNDITNLLKCMVVRPLKKEKLAAYIRNLMCISQHFTPVDFPHTTQQNNAMDAGGTSALSSSPITPPSFLFVLNISLPRRKKKNKTFCPLNNIFHLYCVWVYWKKCLKNDSQMEPKRWRYRCFEGQNICEGLGLFR